MGCLCEERSEKDKISGLVMWGMSDYWMIMERAVEGDLGWSI